MKTLLQDNPTNTINFFTNQLITMNLIQLD